MTVQRVPAGCGSLEKLGLPLTNELFPLALTGVPSVGILKPHGSLDWYDSKEVSIKADLVFPLNGKYKRIQVFKRFRPPRISSPAVPVIVPPVIKKKIVDKELQSTWRDAWLALRHAGEIYVTGHCLPPEDLHARLTIRSAIRGNEKFKGHQPRRSVCWCWWGIAPAHGQECSPAVGGSVGPLSAERAR